MRDAPNLFTRYRKQTSRRRLSGLPGARNPARRYLVRTLGAPITIEDGDDDGKIICDACLGPDPEVLYASEPDE